MAARCRDYPLSDGEADIVIDASRYSAARWPGLDPALLEYMESGLQFYVQLLRFDGLMLHASALRYHGKAYLFSSPCGIGKSTHTRLWRECFGDAVTVFNDDKPALRLRDGAWYAYGTPWCGKDGINTDCKVPLAGICFLERGELAMRRLTADEAVRYLLPMTNYKLTRRSMERLLPLVSKLVESVPMYLLRSGAEKEAAKLARGMMERQVNRCK